MTIEFRELGPIPLNVHKLRTTVDGRKLLAEVGRWTPETEAVFRENRQKSKEKQAKTLTAPFMGWDGEGVGSKYTLLANSHGQFVECQTGLSTRECLEFLTNTAMERPMLNHVVFGGSYDSNMMLCDLGFYEIRDLVEHGYVWWDNKSYRIEYRPRKSLTVRRFDPERWEQTKSGKWMPKQLCSVTLWDVIGFFQCRFVDAIRSWLPERIPELDFIESMKDKRSEFQSEDPEEIRRYCILECEMLRDLMTEFRNQARWAGYVPTRWDGAGALGARVLTKEKVRAHKSNGFRPPEVEKASRFGYFGGRIEAVRVGFYDGPVWGHDIVSAYPFTMSRLPCLAHGRWVKRVTEGFVRSGGFGIYHVRYNRSGVRDSSSGWDRIYPLPVRKESRVHFPSIAEGWYWAPELANVLRTNPDSLEILEGWEWEKACAHRPFGFVPDLFDKRRRLKRNNHPAEKCLKLALNSLYGKLAQQTGFRLGPDGKPKLPPFHQLEWAGYITSFTRARIFEIAMKNPDAVVAFETDGVYATAPLVDDDSSGELGSWEVREFGGICYVQSGVYWLRLPDGSWKAKYRGINRDTLSLDMVRDGWAEGALTVNARQTRFHGMHIASVNPVTFNDWRQWLDDPKSIQLVPTGKRRHLECPCGGLSDPGLHLTTAVPAGDGVSEEYSVSWEVQEWTRERLELDEAFPDE